MKPLWGSVPLPAEEFLRGGFAPPVYICSRAKLPCVIDGDVFKPFWEYAPYTQPFRDIEGAARPLPLKETRAKLLWDEENLYLGAVIYDDQIWANVSERDGVVFWDNDFEFFLDRQNSTHGYFELEMNALNTLWDLLLPKPYRDGGSALNGFDFKGIESAVKINGALNDPAADNRWWSVELRIPWRAMAGHNEADPAPRPGEYYRFNLSRVEWQTEVKDGRYVKKTDPATNLPYPEYNWVYAPTGVVNIHYPELWAFLVFAGEDEPRFEIPEREKIKWALRKVYYAQRAFYEKNNAFTEDLNALGISSDYAITVEKTASLFEAYARYGNEKISIAQDGYTWVAPV
jgi:hypothetical protein